MFHSAEEFRAMIRKPWFTGLTMTALAINVLTWALLAYKLKPSDLPIFLHYNIYLGIDRTGAWYMLYLMPFSGSVIWIINTVISMLVFYRERVIAILITGMTLSVQIVLMAASVLILLKNLSL